MLRQFSEQLVRNLSQTAGGSIRSFSAAAAAVGEANASVPVRWVVLGAPGNAPYNQPASHRARSSQGPRNHSPPRKFVPPPTFKQPGVGKGTYCSRMAKMLNVPHIAAGDLVRAEIKSKSELGQRMESIVNKGNLLPDTLVADLVLQKLAQNARDNHTRGFILDGFPRTVNQAEILAQSQFPIDLALNFSLREEILVEKCMGR